MKKKKEQIVVAKRDTVSEYEIRMNHRGDILCSADSQEDDDGNLLAVSITKEELKQIVAKAIAIDKAQKALDAAREVMKKAQSLTCCEHAVAGHEITFSDEDNNDIDPGFVAIGCQNIYLKDVIRIAALSAKMRGK